MNTDTQKHKDTHKHTDTNTDTYTNTHTDPHTDTHKNTHPVNEHQFPGFTVWKEANRTSEKHKKSIKRGHNNKLQTVTDTQQDITTSCKLSLTHNRT